MSSLEILESFRSYAYPILFLGMILEGGDSFLLASGFLIRLGYLDFYLVFSLTTITVFFRDIFWYEIGRNFGERFIDRFGKFFLITPERFKKIENRLSNHQGKTIFFSKFLYGLNYITIMAVGAIKIDFRKFIKLNSLAIIFWDLVMIGLGFFLGHSFTLLKEYVKDITLSLALVVVIFILFEILIRKKIKINDQN